MPEEVAWKPSVDDVAAYIRARTKVPGGKEVGTFTDETRPTATQVEALIDEAVDHVSAGIGGTPCNESLERSANAAAAMYAAILVETSYFPETSSNAGSSAVRLEALFDKRMETLEAAVSEQCGGQGVGEGEDGNAGAVAAGCFSDGYALIGRDYPQRW